MFSPERIISFANYQRHLLRTGQYVQLDRVLECFWESQIKSKAAILNALPKTVFKHPHGIHGNAYVVGGWYGVMGSALLDRFPTLTHCISIDIDQHCADVGPKLCGGSRYLHFWVRDMASIRTDEYWVPRVIVNTSTEHVTQEIFNRWFEQLPENVPIVLQGNNYYDNSEHIRCSSDMQEFKRMNPLGTTLWEEEIDCGTFTRFMTIGFK